MTAAAGDDYSWRPTLVGAAGQPLASGSTSTFTGYPPQTQAEPTTQDAQAAAEGVISDDGDWVEFLGEKFRLSDSIGLMPLLKFANAAKRGMDSEDMDGMAAMYSMIRDTIWRPRATGDDGQPATDPDTGERLYDEAEWQRFCDFADDEKADGEDLMGFVSQAIQVISARPRKRRGTSSVSSPRTSERSKAVSSSRVIPGAEELVSVAELARLTG